MSELYYYRPLAAYGGNVLKCAGICDESNIDIANEIFIKNNKDPVYLPGVAVVDGYKGDKIRIGRDNKAVPFDPYSAEESASFASAMAAVNELSKSMDLPTGRNYPAWNARKQEAAANRRMNSKPEDR